MVTLVVLVPLRSWDVTGLPIGVCMVSAHVPGRVVMRGSFLCEVRVGTQPRLRPRLTQPGQHLIGNRIHRPAQHCGGARPDVAVGGVHVDSDAARQPDAPILVEQLVGPGDHRSVRSLDARETGGSEPAGQAARR